MRTEVIGPATLILGDAEICLNHVGPISAMVLDPPYGIGEAAGKNKSRCNLAVAKDYGNATWDNAPLSEALIRRIIYASPFSVVWGGNYYPLPPSSCWLVWDKVNGSNDFADCELAWTNLPQATRLIHFMWNGMLRKHGEPRGDHPTQKPVGVMSWAISQLPIKSGVICDPVMGSGTTGVSAVKAGFSFVGIEREGCYFDIACRRIEEAYRHRDLFIPDPIPEPPEDARLRDLFSEPELP